MAITSKERLTLLTLPREIRLRIYEDIFAESEVFLDRQSRHGKPWSLRYDQEICMFRLEDLNVLLTCRTVWEEAIQTIRTARMKQCCGLAQASRIDYRLCYLLLSEAQDLHVKHLITTCSRVSCIKAIIHYQVTRYLEKIEWYTPNWLGPPCINDFLPSGTTILKSVVLDQPSCDRYWEHVWRDTAWREIIYDVQLKGSARPIRIIIKPFNQSQKQSSDYDGF